MHHGGQTPKPTACWSNCQEILISLDMTSEFHGHLKWVLIYDQCFILSFAGVASSQSPLRTTVCCPAPSSKAAPLLLLAGASAGLLMPFPIDWVLHGLSIFLINIEKLLLILVLSCGDPLVKASTNARRMARWSFKGLQLYVRHSWGPNFSSCRSGRILQMSAAT